MKPLRPEDLRTPALPGAIEKARKMSSRAAAWKKKKKKNSSSSSSVASSSARQREAVIVASVSRRLSVDILGDIAGGEGLGGGLGGEGDGGFSSSLPPPSLDAADDDNSRSDEARLAKEEEKREESKEDSSAEDADRNGGGEEGDGRDGESDEGITTSRASIVRQDVRTPQQREEEEAHLTELSLSKSEGEQHPSYGDNGEEGGVKGDASTEEELGGGDENRKVKVRKGDITGGSGDGNKGKGLVGVYKKFWAMGWSAAEGKGWNPPRFKKMISR